MAGWLGSDPDQPLAEINVTPLVDVMLVLLVIFIIAAPLMAQSLKITLPKAQGVPDEQPALITLEIHENGTLTLDNHPITPETLEHRLITLNQQHPDLIVRIAADANTHFDHVAKLLARAQKTGISRIGFATAGSKDQDMINAR